MQKPDVFCSQAIVPFVLALLVSTIPADAHGQIGRKMLFMGHSFHRPIVDRIPFLAGVAGIVDHEQTNFMAGGASGAPEALWNNQTLAPQIKAVLDQGGIDVFGMTYHGDYPGLQGYLDWIGYALVNNPGIEIQIGIPWGSYPGSLTHEEYASGWRASHNGVWHDFIDTLRDIFPGTTILCNPYGTAGADLREAFGRGALPEVSSVIGSASSALHTDQLGHAGDILKELAQLTYFASLYGLDPTGLPYTPEGYTTDLKAMAKSIVSEHRVRFEGAAPVPAMSPWVAALLVSLLLLAGCGILQQRQRVLRGG